MFFQQGRHSRKRSKFSNKLQEDNLLKTHTKLFPMHFCKHCKRKRRPVVQDYKYTVHFKIRVYWCAVCGRQIRFTYLPTKIYHFENGNRVGVIA